MNRTDESRTCTYPGGCPKRATHGIPGVHNHKSAPFCGNHANEGMEDVVSKRCAEPGCSVRNPRFGEPGARKNVREAMAMAIKMLCKVLWMKLVVLSLTFLWFVKQRTLRCFCREGEGMRSIDTRAVDAFSTHGDVLCVHLAYEV